MLLLSYSTAPGNLFTGWKPALHYEKMLENFQSPSVPVNRIFLFKTVVKPTVSLQLTVFYTHKLTGN